MVGKQKSLKKKKSDKPSSEPVVMEFLLTYGWAVLVVLAAIMALVYFGVFDEVKLKAEDKGYSTNESLKLCRSIGMEKGDLSNGNMQVNCFIDNPSLPVKINHVYKKTGINKSELVKIYVEGYNR